MLVHLRISIVATLVLAVICCGIYPLIVWGLSQDNLANSTPVRGAGVVSADTAVTQTLQGLDPQTTYFYKIVADNSTGSAPSGTNSIRWPRTFTCASRRPTNSISP